MKKPQLDSEDQERLQRALQKVSKAIHRQLDLEYWLSKWAVFVTEIETGYELYIEDYTNDLSVRDVLEEIMASLTEDGRHKLGVVIRPIDERFLASTRAVDRPLLESLSDEPRPFWWYRIPKHLESDLEQDLRKEGFL